MENEIMYIKLDDIIPNRFQPREVFDEEALNKLADSIRQHGVIEPILVRPISNKYEIVAGERRYKASVLAGLTKIPAIVRQMDDKESSIVAFIENEHRSDVSAIEEARTMDRILKNNNMTQDELAKELGVNQSTIANKIRLLGLPLEIQEALMHNEISERHARSLLSIKDEKQQIELLNKIKERKMTVRELDSEIKNMNDNMNGYNVQNNGFNPQVTNNMGYMNNGNIGVNNSMPNPMPSMGNIQEQNNTPFNPSDYLNNSPLPSNNMTPPMATSNVMPMGNNFDYNPNPPMNEPMTLNEQMPNNTPEGNDFRNFLNNYDNMQQVGGMVTPNEPAPEENDFMNFLNNYDNSVKPLDETNGMVPSNEPVGNDSNIDNGFMDFLNNYDLNNPLPPAEPEQPVTPPVNPTPVENNYQAIPTIDNNDLYGNYGNVNTTSPMNNMAPPMMNNEPVVNNPLPPTMNTEPSINNMVPPITPSNNVTINNVVPPITSNFDNQYVENNANYVDVSKQDKITDVDTIIDKLGVVVNEIKEKSIFKVDTEETDFDDMYQITIKIDKRDY